MGTRPFSMHIGTTIGGGRGSGGSGGSGERLVAAPSGGGSSNGGLCGNPPALFTGNRSKSDEFLKDFQVY